MPRSGLVGRGCSTQNGGRREVDIGRRPIEPQAEPCLAKAARTSRRSRPRPAAALPFKTTLRQKWRSQYRRAPHSAGVRTITGQAESPIGVSICLRRVRWLRTLLGPWRAPAHTCYSMQRIVVLNPKGGSGKTTIAINLASYYAVHGLRPVLMDFDPQGSTMRWLKKRSIQQPPIHGIAAYERNSRTTRSFHLRAPGRCAAHRDGYGRQRSPRTRCLSWCAAPTQFWCPVLPSDIDIHACSEMHCGPAAGGQGQARRESHRGDC